MNGIAARRRTGIVAAGFAAAMIGLAYASVPLYRMFCETTGFSGTTGRAIVAPGADVVRALGGRTVKVRFDSNLAAGLAWQFRPRVNSISVRIGEKNLAFFTATNRAAATTTGQAGFNVSPDVAGRYFKKIECFCFTEQTLAAGETVQMPVTFFVDPAILNDPVASKIDEITLSYTFYPVDNPAAPAVKAAQSQITPNRG
jgi:cytochrome c oxidase assembly protein subunit 11